MRRSCLYMALGTVLLCGCSTLGDLGRDHPGNTAVAPSSESVQAAQLGSYVSSLQQLVQGSPAEQAEVIASAKAAYDGTHQGPGQLRYALALAAPNHPAHDAAQAQRLLREALARPELLGVMERALAIIELQRVDAELRLTNENERLVTEAQRERDRQHSAPPNAATARRLQQEIDENARLRKALEEARAKLDAIANIERSLSDRPPANEGRTP
jgi:hypothetical protein